jgi:hypothetical protein
MTITGVVNTTVKVFDQPSSAATQTGTLYKGNTITASSNSGTWLRLLTRNGVYIAGYANSRVGEGMTNGDITWRNSVTPPPPPPPVTDVFPPEVGIIIGAVTKWYIPK